jgi:hypothetical protein
MENQAEIELETLADGEHSRKAFDYPFEQFKDDMCWIYYLQVQMVAAMTDTETALHLIGKSSAIAAHEFIDLDPACIPTELGFTYEDIRYTDFARSLEAMYHYAYRGEVDYSIEPLGPGGYHIVTAAIINDLAKSSLVNFWMHIGGNGRASVMNCLRIAELANARLVLEGEERFFNFEGNDDYDSLAITEREEPPQGGYGKAVTIRQMALLADMGEPTIRTAANPKRARHIPTYSASGRTVIAIEDAKAWLQKKGRYLSIKPKDIAAFELAQQGFRSIGHMLSVIEARLNSTNREATHKLGKTYGLTAEDLTDPKNPHFVSALGRPGFISELADLLSFPSDLFALRVEEVLLDERLRAIRRQVKETIQVNPFPNLS